MQRLTRLVPLAVALTLIGAPGAIAPAFAQGSKQMQQQHSMVGATSTKHLLDHAYQEALHAHEAAALGMNDMATNHLENVRLTIAMVERPQSGMDQGMQQQLAAIRESLSNIDLPDDRARATQDTQRVVSQFVALYNRAPQGMGGGGGAGAPGGGAPTAFDLTSVATTEAAGVQTSVVARDWAAAETLSKNLVSRLDQAIKAGESGTHRLDAAIIKDLKSIRQDANQIMTHARNKNQEAGQAAGKLVGRLGAVTPKIALNIEKQQGGGAGKQKR
jgi:hypothetical protein